MAMTYQVPDMHCQHCVNAITSAIQKDMPQARVNVDLDTNLVVVSDAPAADQVAAAIEKAGYTARQL